jgi:hypothetical protein
MDWFQLVARGHHGYPQPEEGYRELTYSDMCPACGWHDEQVKPIRFRREPGTVHSHVLQLNWIFDAYFVRPEVAADCAAAGLTGITFRDAVRHSSGQPLTTVVQLMVTTVRPCVRVGSLQAVTCQEHNEEGDWRSPTAEIPERYCGRVKHHPPTAVGVQAGALDDAPDAVRSAEWFGSGASAHRLTLVSARFAELITRRRWRGVTLEPVLFGKDSERAI